MKIYRSSLYVKTYKRVTKKDPAIHLKVKEKLKLFLDNPQHPSLKLHKLKGGSYQNWSLSVTRDLRILFSYTKDGLILVKIGGHDQVY